MLTRRVCLWSHETRRRPSPNSNGLTQCERFIDVSAESADVLPDNVMAFLSSATLKPSNETTVQLQVFYF
jgi:hypothetical protein